MAQQVRGKFKVIGEYETTKGERLRLKISEDENRLRLEISGGRWVSEGVYLQGDRNHNVLLRRDGT
jgi:hypothetical protein